MSSENSIETDPLSPALESVREALRGLRFGTVTIVVHEGAVVQVDRTEKLRLARREA